MPTGSNGRQGRTGRAVRANQLALLALVAVVAAEAGAEASRGRRHPAQWSRLGPRQQRLQQHARQLRQQGTQLYAGVAGATSVEQHVLSIGQDLFGEFTCLSPCFGGYECLWQSTYLGPCASPDSRWLWDNSTQHLRQRSTPDVCLTVCPTQNSTEGPCAVHDQILSKVEQHVGVYWTECTNSTFQRWRRAPGQQWRVAANDYCITAEPQSCGELSSCTNTSAPVGNQHSIIAGPCPETPSTAWVTTDRVAAAPETLKADPPPPPLLPPASLSDAELRTYQLVAAGLPGTQCLVAEYATPCNPGVDSAVCAWHNAAVRKCEVYAAAPLAQHPEDVWFTNATLGTLRWAGAPQADGCLDECLPGDITGACAFPNTSSNVGWKQCTGAANQKWAFQTADSQQSPTTTLTAAATGAKSCLGYNPICVMNGHPSRPLSILTPETTVIPAICWNALTNDSLSWASRPIGNDTNFVPVLSNAQMEQCASGIGASSQLWTHNYVLSGGTASIGSVAQVVVQLTVRMQGTALLRFGTAAADAVLAALTKQVPELNDLDPALQQIEHFACPNPRSQGIGCLLSPQQLASATGQQAGQFAGKLQQVMFTAAFTATGAETGAIVAALRRTSSDGADSTIRAAQASLATGPSVNGVDFRKLTSFDVLVSGLDPSTDSAAAPGDTQLSGGALAGTVIGVVLGVALIALLVGLFVVRRRRQLQYSDAVLLPETSMDLNGGTSEQSTMMFGGKPNIERMSLWSMKSGSSRGMRTMGKMDASIQGWYIDPAEISICKRPEDDEDWLLGTGSYGKVYKALRGGVQDVAVKVLLATDEEQLLQFEKEIGILKSISYDRNIVQFYGATMVGTEPMLLLEYCEGGDLRGALAADNAEADIDGERQLGWYNSGHRIALDVARGLSFLHGINVVHSDLKALNILLTRGWEVAKIGDVGVARFMHAKDGSGEVAMATFAYAAPEVLLGIDSGVKSDIFSFGVVLWEIVTGGFATRGRLHPPVVPEQCPLTIADLISACMQPDPNERPTARELFERMRDAAAPISNWHGSADCLTQGGGSSETASNSAHASGQLHPVQEEGVGSHPLGPSPLGARIPSNTSVVSSLGGQGSAGGTGRSRASHASSAISRPSAHIERSSVSVSAASFSRHSGHSAIPSRDTARWHRHAAVARFRAESAPIFGPWPGNAANLQRGNSSSNVLTPSPRKEWASTLRPTISCGAPGAAYNAYADFDAASQGGQMLPGDGGLAPLRSPSGGGARSVLSPQFKTLSSPECAAAMTAAAEAVAGGQRPRPLHPVQHPLHQHVESVDMLRRTLAAGEPSIRVSSASAAEPRNPFSDTRYQQALSNELRADSDIVLAHGGGGTPLGSSLASIGSCSPASISHAGSASPPGTGSPGDGSGGSRPSASPAGGRVQRRPPLPPASPNARHSIDSGRVSPADSTPERKLPLQRPDRIDEHRGWQGATSETTRVSSAPAAAGSPYSAVFNLPMLAPPKQRGPPKLQLLDEPMYGSPPTGNPYMMFLESPSSHDFQRGERMRPSPPAALPVPPPPPAAGDIVVAAVAGSLAAASAGFSAAASAALGLWSEPSLGPAQGFNDAEGGSKPPGFNGATVGPNPFAPHTQSPPNPFAAFEAQQQQQQQPHNPFAEQSAPSQGSMSPQSSLSISSPRQPPPSPYASLSLQSADDESVDGSGPLSSTNGGSGSLLVQQASAAAAGAEAWQRAAGSQQQQLPLTVAHEGRSGSLEDRAVSFDSWKVPELLAAASSRQASPPHSAGASPDGSPKGRPPASQQSLPQAPQQQLPQGGQLLLAAGPYAAFAAASSEPWPKQSPPPTPKFAQQNSAKASSGDQQPFDHSAEAAKLGPQRRSTTSASRDSGSSPVKEWLSEPSASNAAAQPASFGGRAATSSAAPALPRESAEANGPSDARGRSDGDFQQLQWRGSSRAKSAPKAPPKNPAKAAATAWPGFQPQALPGGFSSTRRSSAPAIVRQRQPGAGSDAGGAQAAQHPIFVPESSFWEPRAEAALLQGIWQRWGTGGGHPVAVAGPDTVKSPSFATRSAMEARAASPVSASGSESAPLETRPSFDNVLHFAYEDEGRQPSAIVRPKAEVQRAAAAAGDAAAVVAASRASSRAASLAASDSESAGPGDAAAASLQQQPPQMQPSPPEQQQLPSQQQQQPGGSAAAEMPAVPPVQRGEGMAGGGAGFFRGQVLRSVSRGSISRPDLRRPSLGRSSLGLASVSRRSVSRTLSRSSLPAAPKSVAAASADSAPASPYAAFTAPPAAAAAPEEAAAAALGPGSASTAAPATPTRQPVQQGDAALLASAAAYKTSRSATPKRLPVDGAADVRAAADAAAEAMASRFAGRKATHAAHAKPVAGPETPNQSREPTPRDGDAQPQGRPELRRTSVRRHTQKIRPSMLPLAALTARGSASANSLNEDGLAALDAILDARSKAEKARAAKEDTERLEDLAAKLASMRSMPPAVRTATPTQGRGAEGSLFNGVSKAATRAARAARSASVPAPVPESSQEASPLSSPGRIRLPRSPFASDEPPDSSSFFSDVTPYIPVGMRQRAMQNGGLHALSAPQNKTSDLPLPSAALPNAAAAAQALVSRCSSRAESLRKIAEAEAAADLELDHLMAGLSDWSAAEQMGLLRG